MVLLKRVLALLLALVGTESAGALDLSLPRCLRDKPVCYVPHTPLPDFSCGFQTLFNACCIEARYNTSAPCGHTPRAFRKIVRTHLKKFGEDPLEPAYSDRLCEVAEKLGLDNYYFMVREGHRGMRPWLPYPVACTGSKQAKCRARIREERAVMNNLKKAFKKTSATTAYCAHFACDCILKSGEEHAILVSLVKNKGKATVYVYDNLNEPLTPESDITVYIKEICRFFDL